MKKLLALACATSALALSSGAWADTLYNSYDYSIAINGTVGTSCTLSLPEAADTPGANEASGTHSTATIGGVTFNYSALADSNFHIKGATGHVTFPVTTNDFCQYTLSGTNGNLNGTDTPIAYTAGMKAGTTAPAISELLPGANGTISTLTLPNAKSSNGDATVTVGFHIPADNSKVFAGGQYSEILKLNILPKA
jgi:hypothetical protein